MLHTNAGYLVDDERRDALFARLWKLAPNPAALLRATTEQLMAIANDGGMHPAVRVERWREIARRTLGEADGDLDGTLRSLPLTRARRLLKGFPSIGDPGADHALLFAGIAPLPTVESNGLRVLVRLGFVASDTPYAPGYRAAVGALLTSFGPKFAALRRAYTVLRRHGKTICRRSAPECPRCPLRRRCPSATTGAASRPR